VNAGDDADKGETAMVGSTIIPGARYKDAPAAMEFLCSVFGFTRHAVYEGPDHTIAHAELTLGGGLFMLGSANNNSESTDNMATLEETGGRETIGLYLVVDDCEAVYKRAQAAGADITTALREPEHTPGTKEFTCKDPGGHVWWVGSYNPWDAKDAEV
jgi:uncharacterized glyoxalase superfamily protein PhnB